MIHLVAGLVFCVCLFPSELWVCSYLMPLVAPRVGLENSGILCPGSLMKLHREWTCSSFGLGFHSNVTKLDWQSSREYYTPLILLDRAVSCLLFVFFHLTLVDGKYNENIWREMYSICFLTIIPILIAVLKESLVILTWQLNWGW